MIIRTIAKKETTKRVVAYARVSTLAESQAVLQRSRP